MSSFVCLGFRVPHSGFRRFSRTAPGKLKGLRFQRLLGVRRTRFKIYQRRGLGIRNFGEWPTAFKCFEFAVQVCKAGWGGGVVHGRLAVEVLCGTRGDDTWMKGMEAVQTC